MHFVYAIWLIPAVLILHIHAGIGLEEAVFGAEPSADDAAQHVFFFLAGFYAVAHEIALQHGVMGAGDDPAFGSAEIEGGECPFHETALEIIVQRYYQGTDAVGIKCKGRLYGINGIDNLYFAGQTDAEVIIVCALAIGEAAVELLNFLKGEPASGITAHHHLASGRVSAREHIAPLLLGEAGEVDAVAAGWGIDEGVAHDEVLVGVVAEHHRLIPG